jgi:hypothetical protein
MEDISIKSPEHISPQTKKTIRKALGVQPTKFGTVHFRLHDEYLELLKHEANKNQLSIGAMIELILSDRYENNKHLVSEID